MYYVGLTIPYEREIIISVNIFYNEQERDIKSHVYIIVPRVPYQYSKTNRSIDVHVANQISNFTIYESGKSIIRNVQILSYSIIYHHCLCQER